MKEHPILFFTPMVLAILEGRKTQTRRVLNPQPYRDVVSIRNDFAPSGVSLGANYWCSWTENGDISSHVNFQWKCPYGQVGDRLWVRETFADGFINGIGSTIIYKADNPDFDKDFLKDGKWKPSIFMTRSTSRITLEITDIRVEQLQDISEEDAIAEGIDSCPSGLNLSSIPASEHFDVYFDYGKTSLPTYHQNPITSFKSLWDSINAKKHPWANNDWVWVVEFKRIEK